MSRYDWPSTPRPRRGRAALRRAYNESRNAGAGSADTTRSGLVTAAEASLSASPAAAPAVPGRVWVPLGPTGTLRGTGDADPKVAGRVRDVAVSPDGQRLYAASALGGLWYSGDAGATWEPVGRFATTPPARVVASSGTLTCGAVHVRFDPGGDVAQDEVFLATGEPDPAVQPTDIGVGGHYGGVGVLQARGPVATVRANANADPWTAEAQPAAPYPGLLGAGVFAVAEDPASVGQPAVGALVAATTRGLHLRTPGAAGDPWSLVTVAAWEAPNGPGSAQVVVTDVVWVRTPGGDRLWVAVAGRNVDQRVKGLWRSDNGAAGPFVQVPMPGIANAADRTGLLRLALAAAPSDPTVVYVLANAPRLWRADGDATVRRVRRLPGDLFSGVPGQSEYDMAIAVDPANPQRVMLAGALVTSSLDNTSFAAALYRVTVQLPVPPPGGQWQTDYVGGNPLDATWVGAEIHPDVHRVRWVRPGGAASGQVLVCCDGGVWRSVADGDRLTFSSRAAGLAVTEAGFVASHPASPGVLLAGVQDNATQIRIGESVWRQVLSNGDGGGVAFDPGSGDRFMGQASQAAWIDQAGTQHDPTFRTGDTAPRLAEQAATRMYSDIAVIRRPLPTDVPPGDGVTQIAVGTNRVWYSERWLHSYWDSSPPGVYRFSAVTLPSGTDPRSNDLPDTVTDVLPPGPMPAGTVDTGASGIRVLRWAGIHRLYALMWGAVHRLDRNPANGTWARTRIYARPAAPPVPGAAAGPDLPSAGSLNDLAVHQAATGPHGSFYLATSNPLEPIWWFDGTGTWHPCSLGAAPPNGLGLTATGYAVVVDPANDAVVHAGTSIGVFQGTLSFPAGAPHWDWVVFSNGLPEAAAQDLEIVAYPTPDGAGRVRLLRAALQARGVWEVDLDADLAPLTYLRANPYDTRRLLPTPMPDPQTAAAGIDAEWHLDWSDARARDFRTGAGVPAPHPDGTPVATFSWHASPDIRVRPAPGAPAPAPPVAPSSPLPWTSRPRDKWALWALQTSLHAIDPLIVPDGRWTATFRRRLRAIRTARGLSDAARVDADLWTHHDVAAAFWSDPWSDGGPTEADLVERVVGRATPRPGGPMAATASPASVAMPAGPAKVEVCVHHRGAVALAPTDVAVLLLTMPLPADPATWAALGGTALADVSAAIQAAMTAVGPVGGVLPGGALPAGYAVADTGIAIRRPRVPLEAARPVVVSFDLDLTGVAVGTRLLLLAVVQGGAGTPTLAGAGLRDVVLASPQAAARSIEVV